MPEFPYPPDVNGDLRDLFRLDRQDRAARDLGASSITRGEGSMDLYDTDDGPVVGRYGDLPDGSFGVGFTHRGTFWNASDLIGQGQDHDAAQDATLSSHDTRITNAWVRADAARNRADDAHDRLDGHDTRITNAWARGNAAGIRADAAHDRLDGHASRLGNAEGRLDSHVSRIGAAESTLSSHDTRITNAQARANSARDRADSAYDRAGNARGRADDAYARATKIINCIAQVGTASRSTGGMSTMAEPDDWQQLKNCLAS